MTFEQELEKWYKRTPILSDIHKRDLQKLSETKIIETLKMIDLYNLNRSEITKYIQDIRKGGNPRIVINQYK